MAVLSKMAVESRNCSTCGSLLTCTADNFKPIFGPSGIEYLKTCRGCAASGRERSRIHRAKAKGQSEMENDGPSAAEGAKSGSQTKEDLDDASEFLGL